MHQHTTRRARFLLLALLIALSSLPFAVSAQTAARMERTGNGAPAGACRITASYTDTYVDYATGDHYNCVGAPPTNAGTWTKNGTAGGAGGANTGLSNLASVALNASLLAGTAGAVDVGSATKPVGFVFFSGTSGTPGTNNFKFIGASTSGTRTIEAPDSNTRVPIASQFLTFTGPTAARTITLPDAAFTVARTDAANTFIGVSSTTSWSMTTPVIAGGLTASGSGANTFAGSSGTFLTSTGVVTIGPGAVGVTGIASFTPPARSSGVAAYFTLTPPADTGQTTATESIGANFATATRTWVDGTVALQRERFFAGPTYNKTTTSATFTDVFNSYFTPPVAGAGVTFTRGHSLGIVDSTNAASAITGGLVVATTLGTAATSVGIGGGNIFAGGVVTASSSVNAPLLTNPGSLSITTSASNGNITLDANGTGIIITSNAIVHPNNLLTDNGSTIATDASLGNNFRVSALTANVTLSNPTNPIDGQVITWEVIQHASAAKTLAFGAAFGFGVEITACTISAAVSSHNFITAIYNSTTAKWYVRGCLTGY